MSEFAPPRQLCRYAAGNTVNDIPKFEDALASFRRFLEECGHSTDIIWVFRDDIWKRSVTEVFVRIPSQQKTFALARKVFDEGRTNGLVDIHAVAIVDDAVA